MKYSAANIRLKCSIGWSESDFTELYTQQNFTSFDLVNWLSDTMDFDHGNNATSCIFGTHVCEDKLMKLRKNFDRDTDFVGVWGRASMYGFSCPSSSGATLRKGFGCRDSWLDLPGDRLCGDDVGHDYDPHATDDLRVKQNMCSTLKPVGYHEDALCGFSDQERAVGIGFTGQHPVAQSNGCTNIGVSETNSHALVVNFDYYSDLDVGKESSTLCCARIWYG